MNIDELKRFMRELNTIFDVVRLVNVSANRQYTLSPQGELMEGDYFCFATWKKNERCENCSSARAIAAKSSVTKFEFIGKKVFFVISQYVAPEGIPLALEVVKELNDSTEIDVFGQNVFTGTIQRCRDRMYRDSLTGAYNRNYYEEQITGLIRQGNYSFAMLDIDNFKQVNDVYGHEAGDKLLKLVVKTIKHSIRHTDMVIRYGGDEFLIVFYQIEKEMFHTRLLHIRDNIRTCRLAECPQLIPTVSIGGISHETMGDNPIQQADQLLYRAKKTKDCVETA